MSEIKKKKKKRNTPKKAVNWACPCFCGECFFSCGNLEQSKAFAPTRLLDWQKTQKRKNEKNPGDLSTMYV